MCIRDRIEVAEGEDRDIERSLVKVTETGRWVTIVGERTGTEHGRDHEDGKNANVQDDYSDSPGEKEWPVAILARRANDGRHIKREP